MTAKIESMASGRLSQNAQRQPGPSVIHPPMSGPATEEKAKTPPMIPMYLPRSRAGITSATTDWERIMRPPPPTPWSARATISQVISGASAPIIDPVMKERMAKIRKGLRPNWSESLPYTGMVMVESKMKVAITQLICSTPCSSPTMVGSEGARMVWFSADMSITMTKPENMSAI